tara:strand:+ start:490 stop:684 length:195 start_codon:yes stop_codon:yes gene_type:complete
MGKAKEKRKRKKLFIFEEMLASSSTSVWIFGAIFIGDKMAIRRMCTSTRVRMSVNMLMSSHKRD